MLLEKEMETHSSFLAWKIPWTEEPGNLQSVGSQKSQAQRIGLTTTGQHYVLYFMGIKIPQ